MFSIISVTIRKNLKDMYLLFWSIFLPLAVFAGLYFSSDHRSSHLLFGILSISIFFYCCTTNAFSIFAQRKRGVFDLLSITPFSIVKYLVSISLSQTVIAGTVSFLLLIVENFIFDLRLTFIQLVFFLPYFVLASILFTLLGYVISRFPENEGQLSITANLLMFPLLLCSSVFFDLDNLPKAFQSLSLLSPFEWLEKGFESIVSFRFQDYGLSLAVMAVFLVICSVFARKSFAPRRY